MEKVNVEGLESCKEEKRKLEDKYSLRICDLAAQPLSTLASNRIINTDKAGILEGACNLVFERFRKHWYERAFCEKAHELRWALVELIELHKQLDSDTQSWVAQLRWERDCATIFMDEFRDTWRDAVMSYGGLRVLTPDCLHKLSLFNKNNFISKKEEKKKKKKSNSINASSPEKFRLDDANRLLDEIRANLIHSFRPLLTVKQSDVAEVVSNMTDVPSTLILASRIGYQKNYAINMTCLRVVDQEHVISEIYETLASSSSSSSSSTRPRGSFLLFGQSGAGKTEIAKAVAKHWYCDASRLVEIDVSDYADGSVLRRRLSEVVEKRPFSVIVLKKIEKASPSVTRALVDVLSNVAPQPPSDVVDLSNSVIFMTSNQLALRDTLKGSGPEIALVEARKLFSSDLVESVDKVFVVKRCRKYKTVLRVLLREIVRELIGQGLVVHASDAALYFLVVNGPTQYHEEGGKALKKALLEHIIPRLLSEGDLDNVVVHIDRLGGAHELSFRFQKKRHLADEYFKQKNGTFDRWMSNLKTKVESVGRIFELRSEYGLLDSNHEFLVDNVCNEIQMWSSLE